TCERSDVDDVTLPLTSKYGEDRFRDTYASPEIGLKLKFCLLKSRLLYSADNRDPRIVDHNVDTWCSGKQFLNTVADRFIGGDIKLQHVEIHTLFNLRGGSARPVNFMSFVCE